MRRSVLSGFQLFSLFCFSMLFGMTLLPSAVGHDITSAWFFAQIITVAVVFTVMMLFLKTVEACPDGDFRTAAVHLLGKVPSKLLTLSLSIYFLIQAGRLLLTESNNLMLFLFERTPMWAIVLVFSISCAAVGHSGLKQIAKTSEMLTPMFILILAVLFSLLLFRCDWGEVKTLFQPEVRDIPRQVALSMNSFTCVELAFLAAFDTDKINRRRAMISGFLVCALFLLTAFIALTGIYTVKAGAQLVFPFTELTRSLEFGTIDILERFDVVFLSFRIVVCIIFAALACDFSVRCLSGNPEGGRRSIHFAVYALLFCLVYLCNKFELLPLLNAVSFWGECAVLLLLIPFCFLLSRIRREAKK